MNTPIAIHAERAYVNGSMRSRSVAAHSGGVEPIPAHAAKVRLDERYLLLPGLINAHDHLEFNSFPFLGRRAAYKDMYEWAAEIKERMNSLEIRACTSIPIEDRLRIGAFKNLISGVTTVAHHNPYHPCFDRGFPIRVVQDYRWSHSLGLDNQALDTFRETPGNVPWIIHAAEGVSARAESEIDELDGNGMLAPNTVLVHALGAQPSQHRLLAQRKASVVSCPVSNLYLYGRTLDYGRLPTTLKLALGSDSAATSSSGLLEDFQLLRTLVDWKEEKLWATITTVPTEILRIHGRNQADLVVLKDGAPALVVLDGRALYGNEEFRDFFDGGTRRITVREVPKLLSKRIHLPWKSLAHAAEWTPYLREISF